MNGIREPKPIKVECVMCGKTFTALRKSARYCSTNCRAKAQYRRDHATLSNEEFEVLNNQRLEKAKASEQRKKRKVDNIEKVLKENNGNYADYQKKQSIELYARVNLEGV